MAQYEAKFTEVSRFIPQLIAIEEEKALKFQDGLKLTHPHPLLAAGVPATPQKSPAVTSND